LGQPHLIKNLENKFGDTVMSLQKYWTPGMPGQGIVWPKKDEQSVPLFSWIGSSKQVAIG
jgi:hypothetical protein